MSKPTEPKTEGQRQLLTVYGSERTIAEKVGCSRAMVGHWRRGFRFPSNEQKHKLELLFGIPRRAWDLEPGAEIETIVRRPDPEPKEEKPTEEAPRDPSKLASRAKGSDTLTITNAQIEDILEALDDPNLTDSAQSKLRDTLSKALALRARLERDRELLEDRIIRDHPGWLKLKTNILKALESYPAAAKAVIEAIGGSGRQ